jgi:hypothetical protein
MQSEESMFYRVIHTWVIDAYNFMIVRFVEGAAVCSGTVAA